MGLGRVVVWLFVSMLVVAPGARGADVVTSPYARWSHGPSSREDYFPIAVWLQNPANAQRYRAAGFNLYVGLWKGPTDEQLSQLKEAGMQVICAQNDVGLRHVDDPTIVGWLQQDEPDNAQSLGKGKGYGPPVLPEKVVQGYERRKAADPTRPVLLNLGQAVAWDGWRGRGVRTNHPEDYPEYVKGCDIASFDIYPVTHRSEEVSGNLWYVARGVERLKGWTRNGQPVWNCIECAHINSENKPTPHQVRCEVWMSIIHGSQGLIYFVHEWKPRFSESALLNDPEMYAAVTRINHQIAELAPVLNRPTVPDAARAVSENTEVPVATMVKRYGRSVYLFAVAMREGRTRTRFTIEGLPGRSRVEVLGEDRTLESRDGVFEDTFQPWDVHLYRMAIPTSD